MEIQSVILILSGILSIGIMYFVIRSAVKNGILSAWRERDRRNALSPLARLEEDYQFDRLTKKEFTKKKEELLNSEKV